ncbi:MAG: NAD-dependent deacylase [Bacteroidales bacterium]|nr:NAD-dependent deacylase [Bacteroidales bacterium]
MKNIVILTGAGMSAESGLKTFRDDNGLWKTYRFEELASPDAWKRNPALVMEFYNQRRKQLLEVEPNIAHFALAKLETCYNVHIITQNVDDLHERAGSSNILHLHGELRKSQSTIDENLVYEIKGWELKIGDTCEKGSQLRPHVVWFGEQVTQIVPAIQISRQADLFIVIGTSLAVYPAAGLIGYVDDSAPKYLIDPKSGDGLSLPNLKIIREKAGIGVPKLVEELIANA